MKNCVNGCQRPVQEPSKVLCKECLEKLDRKFHGFGDFFENDLIPDGPTPDEIERDNNGKPKIVDNL